MDVINRLEEMIQSNPSRKYSIAYFDLDRTLTYPEEVRDTLILNVKDFIQKQIRYDENFIFYGGERDEFIIIIRDFSKIESKDFVDKLIKEIEKEFKSFNLTGSAGVVHYPDDSLEVTDLMRRAEEALNKAKRLGRNKAIVLDDKMVMRSNYYPTSQLNRLRILSNKLNQKESEILREILGEFLRENGI